MDSKRFQTDDAEAYSNFVQGRALFQSYLGTGRGEQLQQARDRFKAASTRDGSFEIAKLYLGATHTELREADEAIQVLTPLAENPKCLYLAEARIQLAYAHTKKYKDEDFVIAEQLLRRAAGTARDKKRDALIDSIEAYRIFVLGARCGYGHDSPDRKKLYLDQAISDGGKLLAKIGESSSAAEDQLAALFEAENAMGIAYLFRGKLFEESQAADWKEADKHLKAALKLRPRSVRALENMGILRMFQGDQETEDLPKAQFYEEGKQFVKQALALNSYDQFPHFQMALLSARTADWKTARESFVEGRRQPGAVGDEKWAKLDKVIDSKETANLLTLW